MMDDLSRREQLLHELDRACDQFEEQFRAGQTPRIEEVLALVEPGARCAWRRCLLEIELELRREQGEQIRLDEYLTRFPDVPESIYSAFAAVCPEMLELPSQ